MAGEQRAASPNTFWQSDAAPPRRTPRPSRPPAIGRVRCARRHGGDDRADVRATAVVQCSGTTSAPRKKRLASVLHASRHRRQRLVAAAAGAHLHQPHRHRPVHRQRARGGRRTAAGARHLSRTLGPVPQEALTRRRKSGGGATPRRQGATVAPPRRALCPRAGRAGGDQRVRLQLAQATSAPRRRLEPGHALAPPPGRRRSIQRELRWAASSERASSSRPPGMLLVPLPLRRAR